jgi:signal transduction histidine kinase
MNARDHAEASQIRVTLNVDDRSVRGVVEDNGKGFNVSAPPDPSQRHIGLSTLREKAELLGGHLDIDSTVGQGTQATFEFPIGDFPTA